MQATVFHGVIDIRVKAVERQGGGGLGLRRDEK
jgi:hypothetical protein